MDELKKELEDLGQEHIIEQLPELKLGHPIVEQLRGLEIRNSLAHYKSARSKEAIAGEEESIIPLDPSNVLVWKSCDPELRESICSIGWESIRAGQVGAVIMSGGQGTRLGFDGPKGMYDMNLPSGKSIFCIHIERINRIRTLARDGSSGYLDALPRVPVYIMTSEINTKIIENYFKDNSFFGYPKEDIFFFEQSLEPCVTFDGKVVIESDESLSLAPDGNGGIYNALRKSGAIDDMEGRGIQHLHIYGIDNVLTKSLDPAFIGCCVKNGSEIGNKVVWRANKSEKVGVAAEKEGKMVILEYSEIPKALAETCDEQGKLVYGAGNICNHYMKLSFLINDIIPNLIKTYHLASKKLPYMDPESRETIQPINNNGYKLEMYIFDVFPLANKWTVMEVIREDEFAPVKNGPGNPADSPDTAKRLLSEQATRWLIAAGAKIQDCRSTSGIVEISPTLSYEGEGLERFEGKVLQPPCYLN